MKQFFYTLALVFICNQAYAVRWYVNINAPGSNGNSWATASDQLDLILQIANSGDSIWVAQGRYIPQLDTAGDLTGDKEKRTFFIKSGLCIFGGFNGTETAFNQRNVSAYPTILSGDVNNNDIITGSGKLLTLTNNTENIYHIVCVNNPTAFTTLDGFIIEKGYEAGISTPFLCTIAYESSGSAVLICNSNHQFTLANCIIRYNLSHGNGSVSSKSGNTNILNCTFENNISGEGAGLYCEAGNPTIRGCIFTGNKCTATFLVSNGAGLRIKNCNATISKNIFYNNYVYDAGFYLGKGGGLYISSGSSTTMCAVNNCVFANNEASQGGGMAIASGGHATVTNSTFFNNKSASDGEAYYGFGINSNDSLRNNIFWGATGNVSFGAGAITHCNFKTNLTGLNCIYTYPNFVDTANLMGADGLWMTADDGLQLVCNSACVNTGTNSNAPTTDILNNAIANATKDMGAYENNTPSNLLTRVYVKKGSTGDGSSWLNAFGEVADALWSLSSCNTTATEVWIAQGTYYPSRNIEGILNPINARTKTFLMKNGVAVYGGFAGNETLLSQRNLALGFNTLLDGDIGVSGTSNYLDNVYHVVTFQTAVINTTILNGCIIKSGYANVSNANNDLGAGIYCNGQLGACQPTISQCIISANYCTNSGGGIFADGAGGGKNASPTIINCVFENCLAKNSGSAISTNGLGGNGSASVINCTFVGNSILDTTFATRSVVYYHGWSTGLFQNNIFYNNNTIHQSLVRGAPAGTMTITHSHTPTIIIGSNGTIGNPLFVNVYDPNGIDNIWFTADDGLALNINSTAINSGNNTLTPLQDILGATRLKAGIVDKGAYEKQNTIDTMTIINCDSIRINNTSYFTNTIFTDTLANYFLDTIRLYNITIHTADVQANTSNNIICKNTSALLYGSGANTYTWSNNIVDSIYFVPDSTQAYTVIGVDANGCTGSSVIAVIIDGPESNDITQSSANNQYSISGNQTMQQVQPDGSTLTYTDNNCNLICKVKDAIGGNILGNTNSQVTVESSNSQVNGIAYSKRWYEISPTNNGDATITLFFTQQDFDDYNADSLSVFKLPTFDADPNITNIRVHKINGTLGINVPIIITPTTTFLPTENYWKLEFSVTSFSKFYLSANNNAPLHLALTLAGKSTEHSNQLLWNEIENVNNYEVQKWNGIEFEKIVETKFTNFIDGKNANESLYRIKANFNNAQCIWSNTIKLNANIKDNLVIIFPNPSSDVVTIQSIETFNNATVSIQNYEGQTYLQQKIMPCNSFNLNIAALASGNYILKIISNGTTEIRLFTKR